MGGAQDADFPGAGGGGTGPGTRGGTASRSRLGRSGLGVGVPDFEVFGHVHEEGFAEVIERIGQPAVVAVDFIAADPLVARTARPRRLHQHQGQLRLGPVDALEDGHFHPLAARLIRRPFRGQKEPEIDQCCAVATSQAGEDADLAVLQLAQPPTILALHADRGVALFHKTRLIQIERRVAMAAQQRIRLARHLRDQRPVVPRRIADELLHPLVVARRHILADAPDVFAPRHPEQPAQIMPRVRARIIAVDEEVPPETVAKLHEASRHRFQTGGVIFFNGRARRKSPADCAPEG